MAWLIDLLYPRRCASCGRRGEWICHTCLAAMPPLPEHCCRRCATPTGGVAICATCWREVPSFDTITCGFLFDGPLRTIIHQFKYRQARHLAEPLIEALLATVHPSVDAEAVVPMPLYPSRAQKRGYNQAELLAKVLADRAGRPVHADLLARVRDTPTQTTLPAAQRWENVRGAFQAAPEVQGMHLLLVDDVATTTGTLRAAASALKSRGARQVDALVLARVP